jgi:hypothetical protein
VRWELTWTQLGLIVLALILVGLGIFALVQVTN